MYTRRMRLIRPLTLSQYNRVNKLNDLLLYISQDIRLQVNGFNSILEQGKHKINYDNTKFILFKVDSENILTSSGNMHALRTVNRQF